jgi:2-dehydropantoate 2-reductase
VGKRSYTVLGLGAVGGLYGGRLLDVGHEVHFLVRSGADELRRDGLHLTSDYGDVTVTDLSVFTDPAAVPDTDVVLVALKTTANEALPALLPPLTRDGTIVAMFQNGLGVEAEAAAAAHEGAVILGALCFVCSHRVGHGRIEHIDYGAVTAGEYRTSEAGDEAAGITPAVEALSSDLAEAGVEVRPQEDLLLERWKKLVWNIPYNGLSVVLDAGTDELMADSPTRALVIDLMREVQGGAAACGRTIPDDFVDQMLADTDDMTPYSTSMKLDFDAGRPLELDAIYRRPLDAARSGKEGSFDMVRTEALWRQLRFVDQRNLAEDDLRPTL